MSMGEEVLNRVKITLFRFRICLSKLTNQNRKENPKKRGRRKLLPNQIECMIIIGIKRTRKSKF